MAQKTFDKEAMEQKEVIEAYDRLAPALYGWNDWGYMLLKALTDYYLLSKIEIADKKFLNVGCFLPVDEIQFARMVKKWVAIDLSSEAIKIARKITDEELPPSIAERCIFQVANAGNLPFKDESFDIAVSFSTIDHIPDSDVRKKAVEEMARVTRKGGYVVITVPNKLDFRVYYRSNKAQRKGTCPYSYEYFFFPWGLKKMMVKCGLKPIAFASSNMNPYSYFQKLASKLNINIFKYFGVRMGYLSQKM